MIKGLKIVIKIGSSTVKAKEKNCRGSTNSMDPISGQFGFFFFCKDTKNQKLTVHYIQNVKKIQLDVEVSTPAIDSHTCN